MNETTGPSIVRRQMPASHVKPGFHSHNARRREAVGSPNKWSKLFTVRLILLLVGLGALGYYGYTVADQYVYQAYQNWAFDQQIAGHKSVTFADYIRERTPFGFLTGAKTAAEPVVAVPTRKNEPDEAIHPAEGSLLGRVEIPRLNLSAMVREGVDAKTLGVAVGHVPATALPGQVGNFAIAAHRDTLFRVLKDIRKDDIVTFQSPAGKYSYQVVATEIVRPSDVSVLRSDGGGLIPASEEALRQDPRRLLTMITCYPFYYVGSAPKRFIVEARLISSDAEKKEDALESKHSAPPDVVAAAEPKRPARKPVRQAVVQEPRVRQRGSLHINRTRNRQQEAPTRAIPAGQQSRKKKGLLRRFLHV